MKLGLGFRARVVRSVTVGIARLYFLAFPDSVYLIIYIDHHRIAAGVALPTIC